MALHRAAVGGVLWVVASAREQLGAALLRSLAWQSLLGAPPAPRRPLQPPWHDPRHDGMPNMCFKTLGDAAGACDTTAFSLPDEYWSNSSSRFPL